MKLATLVGDVKNAPIGYLELSGFSTGAASELKQAYRYLDSVANGGLRGVILDLRGNPGECMRAYCWRGDHLREVVLLTSLKKMLRENSIE